MVGASLGGLDALPALLVGLGPDLPAPVVVVQHRSAEAGEALRRHLQQRSFRRLREPEDKEAIRAGQLYLAPADYHLLIDGDVFSLSTEAPVSYARPSVDVLFESAAESFGDGTVAVVLTGANRDGAAGAARVKAAGGTVVVQDPCTAECGIMPAAAIAAAPVDWVLPLDEIAPLIRRLLGLGSVSRHATSP